MGQSRRKIYGIDAVNIFKKGNLIHFLEMLGADDMQSKLWYGDATVKEDLIVEGKFFGTLSADALVTQAQDFKVHRDLIVQDDATVKQDIRTEGNLFAGTTSLRQGSLRSAGDLTIVSGTDNDIEITATGNASVELWSRLQLHHTIYGGSTSPLGVVISDDLVVRDDATVKRKIHVEGQETTYKGITTDLTACGVKYRIVNGIIVEATQKAWA